MKLSLITPTCDQPTGIRLCESFVARQTIYGRVPIEWIVVDDGIEPARLTMGQIHVRRRREPDCQPAQSFCRNLLEAIPLAGGDIVACIEHDDWYAPAHLATICAQIQGGALLAGDDLQRYYHVGLRCWRMFNNRGASLCQTAMRRAALPRLAAAARDCLASSKIGVDAALWQMTPDRERSLIRTNTVLGIKGLPGRPGLGIGHRPGPRWNDDTDLAQLREWIGSDADLYAGFRITN